MCSPQSLFLGISLDYPKHNENIGSQETYSANSQAFSARSHLHHPQNHVQILDCQGYPLSREPTRSPSNGQVVHAGSGSKDPRQIQSEPLEDFHRGAKDGLGSAFM